MNFQELEVKVRQMKGVLSREDCQAWLSAQPSNGYDESAAHELIDHVYGEGTTSDVKPQRIPLTDIGNAERLVLRYGNSIRFNVMEKTWNVWTRKVWKSDKGLILMRRLAKDTARHILEEAANEPDDDKSKAILGHASKSESSRAIDAMIGLAEAEPGIAVNPDDFDTDIWLLNCQNGTLNLKSGLLQQHNPENLLTKMAPTDYDPTAKSDEWEKFLTKTFGGNLEMIGFVQRALGYSITGNTGERAMFFCHGGGSNGKTQLLEAVINTIGHGIYGAETEPTTFMVKRDEGTINEAIANLHNINLVTATETDEKQTLAVSLLKRATGGESLWHEVKFEHGYSFKPRFTLWLSGNNEPAITDNTDSIWDRLYKIPFNNRIPKADRILEYGKLLAKNHASAILTWLVQGCLAWQKQGLMPPQTITDATNKYREDQDKIGEFVRESVFTEDPQAKILVTDLYKAYKAWCAVNESVCLGKETFNAKLETGHKLVKGAGTGNRSTWFGVRLFESDEKLRVNSYVPSVKSKPETFYTSHNTKETSGKRLTNFNSADTEQSQLKVDSEELKVKSEELTGDGFGPDAPEPTDTPPCPICQGDSTFRKGHYLCVDCGQPFDENGNLMPKGGKDNE